MLRGIVGYLGDIRLSGIPFLEDNYPQVSIKSIDLRLQTVYFA
jgi:hypothetical protein